MNQQIKILTWIYQNKHPQKLPIKTGDLYEEYEEKEQYQGSKSAFSKLIRKLKGKGLLESPEYGEYKLSDRGVKKCKHVLGEERKVELDRPDNYGQVVKRLQDFFMTYYEEDMNKQLIKKGELDISLLELDKRDSSVIDFFEDNPYQFLDAVDKSLELFEVDEETQVNLEPDLEHLESDIAQIQSSDYLGKVVVVEGIVKKSENIKHKIDSAVFECTECGDEILKEQDSSKIRSPYKCECGSRKFDIKEKSFVDNIEVEISSVQDTDTSVKAYIDQDKLSKKNQKDLYSGNRIRVIGVLEEKQLSKDSAKFLPKLNIINYSNLEKEKVDQSFEQEEVDEVNVKINESDDPFRDFALSLAPHLGDLELPKKCVAASIIGSPKIERENEIDYGRIHTGIIANPGLGKSALLDWITDEMPKSFIATGERGSGAGLTASVEKTEGGQWELVAGKVVFADKGILAVDEFDKFNEGELVKLNSSMQRGTISVDLATTQAELNARSTIIAAGNFKHPPDDYSEAKELLPEKGQGLYDRFSLLCGVTEQNTDVVHDSMAAGYMEDNDGLNTVDKDVHFDKKELLIFRRLARGVNPSLTMDCYENLKNFAESSTETGSVSEEGSSNRFLQHLIKLSMCMARADLRSQTCEQDAVKAIKLMRESRESLGFNMGDPSFEVWEKNRLKKIKDIVKENYNGEDVAHIEDVVDSAEMNDSKVDEVITKLKRKGELHSPKEGYVAIV